MTITELLQCSPDELDKMSEEQLRQHFEPYLKVTRPEMVVRESKPDVMKSTTQRRKDGVDRSKVAENMAKIAQLARERGLTLPGL